MTAPSIKEALEDLQHFSDTQLECNPKMQKVVATVISALATLQPSGERREAIARIICQSGKFETGQGTCAVICMDQLGDVRKKGCGHCSRVHGKLADAILASGLVQDEAGWRDISTAPKDGTRILWSCGDDKMSVIHWPEYELCFEGGYWMPLPAPPIHSARDGGEAQ